MTEIRWSLVFRVIFRFWVSSKFSVEAPPATQGAAPVTAA
nr:MAG TPA: hypothetical protein [Caudoviricetes sp.]